MEPSHVSALLLIGAFILLALKFPMANVFLSPAVVGLGSENVFGLTFARVVVVLQCIAVVHAIVLLLRPQRINTFVNMLACRNFIPIFVVLVWFKVLFDCYSTGFDEVRLVSLRLGITYSVLPMLMFLLYLPSQGARKAVFSVLVGMVSYSALFIAPDYMDLINQINFRERVVLYDQDTIRGALMIHFAACGWILLAFWLKNKYWKVICLSVSVPFILLLLLNATRQFLVTVLMLGLYVAWCYSKKLAIFTIPVLVLLISYALIFSPSAAERFSAESLTLEVENSRGEIWKGAFRAGFEHPLFGAGFRNYGQEVTLNTEEGPVFVKANAHGYLQDIFAEHGIPLFLLGISAILVAYGRPFKTWSDPVFQTLIAFALCISMPENFSAGATNSFGYHLVAVLPYVYSLLQYEKIHSAKQEEETRAIQKARQMREQHMLGLPTTAV